MCQKWHRKRLRNLLDSLWEALVRFIYTWGLETLFWEWNVPIQYSPCGLGGFCVFFFCAHVCEVVFYFNSPKLHFSCSLSFIFPCGFNYPRFQKVTGPALNSTFCISPCCSHLSFGFRLRGEEWLPVDSGVWCCYLCEQRGVRSKSEPRCIKLFIP